MARPAAVLTVVVKTNAKPAARDLTQLGAKLGATGRSASGTEAAMGRLANKQSTVGRTTANASKSFSQLNAQLGRSAAAARSAGRDTDALSRASLTAGRSSKSAAGGYKDLTN